MSNFVLLYKGGSAPEGDDERKEMVTAWTRWYETLGKAVVDGGNPFSASHTVAADGTVGDGAASELTGYTIIRADNLDAAMKMVQDCPIRRGGVSVEVYETFPVMAASVATPPSSTTAELEDGAEADDEGEPE